MNQGTFLGLTHNPFVPPKEGFYTGADRRTHLEHLRHLSQWSRRILVVTGSFGVGKSTLFRELSANLESRTKGACISGTLANSEQEVLGGLLQGFGVAAPSKASSNELVDLVARHADEQSEHDRVCMIMADDAHLFDANAMNALVGLVARSTMRVVLFAETSAVGNVDRATKVHGLEWFEIRLTGFPRVDVREYLEWRFSQAQYRGRLPFTDEQLDKIVTKSAGNPGAIDSMASNLLIEMETGEVSRQKRGFPMLHASLAGLLVVLVALVYVFVQPPSAPTEGVETLAKVRTVDGEDITTLSKPDRNNGDLGGAGSQTTTIATSAEPSQSTTNTAVANPGGQNSLEIEDLAAGRSGSNGRNESDDLVNDGISSDEIRRNELGSSLGSGGQVAAENGSQGDEGSQGRGSDIPSGGVDTSVASQAPPTTPRPQPATVRSQKPSVMNPSKIPVESSAVSAKSTNWLLAQNPKSYTVQLVTLSSQERARQLVNRQENSQDYIIYPIQRGDKTLHVVLYGNFASHAQGTEAVSKLSLELRKLKPWVRSTGLVQKAIREAGDG